MIRWNHLRVVAIVFCGLLGLAPHSAFSATSTTTAKKRTSSRARTATTTRTAASRTVAAKPAPVTHVVHYYGVPTYADSAKGDVSSFDNPEIRAAAVAGL